MFFRTDSPLMVCTVPSVSSYSLKLTFSFWPPNQQCQNIEGNSEHWCQPRKNNHWPRPFFICQL